MEILLNYTKLEDFLSKKTPKFNKVFGPSLELEINCGGNIDFMRMTNGSYALLVTAGEIKLSLGKKFIIFTNNSYYKKF